MLHDLARMSTATTGTGAITLGSAISGFLSFDGAGVADGEVVSYAIRDGAHSETGTGKYTASGTTLSRDVVISSTNSGAKINLSGSGTEVFITVLSRDILAAHEQHRIVRVDDFLTSHGSGLIGDLWWAWTNGSVVRIASETNHPGIEERRHNSTSHGSMGTTGLTLGTMSMFEEAVFIIKNPYAVPDTLWNFRFGICPAAIGQPPTDGVYIERLTADTSLYGVVRAGGFQSRTAALIAQDNSWHNFRIARLSSTSWSFFVDGTETNISGDANIPGDSVLYQPFVSIWNQSGTAVKGLYLDYVRIAGKGPIR